MLHISAPLRSSRVLWAGVCWFHTGLLFGFGLSFLAFGTKAAAAPHAYEVFVRYVPGALSTYGAVMVGMALLMAYGLCAPVYDRPLKVEWLRRMLLWLLGYDLLLAWMFAWSWVLSGTVTALSVLFWAAFAALCELLRVCSPPPLPDDRPGSGA